jgi:hypothetical protein
MLSDSGITPKSQNLKKRAKQQMRHYGFSKIGETGDIKVRFYAISIERQVLHPAVAAVCARPRYRRGSDAKL